MKTTGKEKAYLRPEDIAERWQVSPGTIRELLRTGRLVGAKLGGQWRIRMCDVYDYEKRQRAAAMCIR